jgi:YheC/D like ATP-grasp
MGVDQKIRIAVFHSPNPLIRVHPSSSQLLNATEGRRYRCFFGWHSAEAVLFLDPAVPANTVWLSDGLSRQVMLNVSSDLVSAEMTTSGLHIGPTIGILCNPKWDSKKKQLKNTKQLPGLQKMVEAGARLGALVYLFRIQDVDFAKEQVKGYVLEAGQWTVLDLPLPDAIYDQVISRKVERDPKYLEQRVRLSKIYAHRIFNDGFFDKWQVHEWLTGDRRTRPYVPQTVKYTKGTDIVQFLKQHAMIFLKPVHGSLGLGIIRIARYPDGALTYEVKQQTGKSTGRVSTLESVVEAVRPRLRSRPYLIQEGISLATYHNRPFDVRIVLQRDGRGEWRRTKMFARVAQPGDFTSNLSSGGEALLVDTVLKELYASEDKRIRCRRLIRKVSSLVTEVIEEQSGKMFGELGIDVGLDDKGHVWIIEVNSKPWKSPTTEKGRQEIVDLAFSRPMEYAFRLANMK